MRKTTLMLVAAALCLGPSAAYAQAPKAGAEIRKVNGIPRLYVNGEAVPMLAYRNRIHDDFPYMKQFADSGVRLFFMTHLIDWNKNWDDHFAEVRRKLDAILDFNDRTVVILGMYLSTSPQWAKDNPNELVWQDGKPLGPMAPGSTETGIYSLASRKFEADAVGIVNRYLDFLEKYPRRDRVIGLFFEGGSAQEWNQFARGKHFWDHPDTGPAMLRAYREYARAKYKTDDALAKAYAKPALTFDTLEIPNADLSMTPEAGDFLDPKRSAPIVDFRRTQSKEISDRMLALGHAAKARMPRLLTGCFHEPLMDGGQGDYEVARILDSPDLDFFSGPPAYEMRTLADHLPIHTIVNSVQAHNKLFFVEEDLRPYGGGGRRFRPPYSDKVVADTIMTYRRDLLHDQADGVMAWVWDFQFRWFGNQQPFFDAFHSLEQTGLLNINAGVRRTSEIAVIVDEDSLHFIRGDNRLQRSLAHRQFLSEMGSLGAPFDVWLKQDVAREDFPLDRYKLVLVFNCWNVNDADRKGFERLKNGGRTIVWLHASGFINEDREPGLSCRNMTELTGFDFGRYDRREATEIIVADRKNELSKLLPLGFTFGQFYRMVDGGRTFPPVTRVSPIFAVEDKQATPVGWYALENLHPPAETSTGTVVPSDQYGDNYYVGLACKRMKDWTSIYAGVVALPAQFIRATAKFAGVHLYVDTDDIVYANDRMLVIHTKDTEGPRTIRLPRATRVWELDGMKPVGDKPVTEFTADLKPLTTYAWWLSDEKPALPALP